MIGDDDSDDGDDYDDHDDYDDYDGLKKKKTFSDKIPCIYLGLWTPTHPPPPPF